MVHSRGLSARKRLFKLQYGTYKSLKHDSKALLGRPPHSIRNYEREFHADFAAAIGKSIPEIIDRSELISAVKSADVTFIGDFHTYAQAQRTAIAIMSEAIKPGEEWLLGLEFVPSHHQGALDEFYAGKLSVGAFHDRINYDAKWGFPWENYAPIFEWAREHGVRLVALNQPDAVMALFGRRPRQGARWGEPDLHERDIWAAGVITDVFSSARLSGRLSGRKSRRRPRMAVLHGELHVATRHLPAQLSRISRSFLKSSLSHVCVHQNNEKLYWRLARRGHDVRAQTVKLMENVYCVFSGTPLGKLQSLVTWVEDGDPESE